MSIVYDRTIWQNYVSALSETPLNNIELGITEVVNALNSLGITPEHINFLDSIMGGIGSSSVPFYVASDGTPHEITQLGVSKGGTGTNTLPSGKLLVGNGTGRVNFRDILNETGSSSVPIAESVNIPTANTIKRWNGAYDSSNNSNLEYVKAGKLGTACIKAVSTSGVGNNGDNLVTEAQVKSFVEGKGYITSFTDTKNTAGATNKNSTKMYLVGADEQTANPQTYTNNKNYVGTDGHLYSNDKKVVNVSDSQTVSNKAFTNSTYEGYSLGEACTKGVDTTTGGTASSNKLITSGAVNSLAQQTITSISFPSSGTCRIVQNGVTTDLPFTTSAKATHIGPTAPSNTDLVWIDSANGYIMKCYDATNQAWITPRAVWGS